MQTIVHVIESLDRGGTEILFSDLLPELSKHYNIVLVTLKPHNIFGDELLKNCYDYQCLDYKGYPTFISSILKLRKIIRKHKPVLVRSQLTMANIIARLACPRSIPFVFSIHSTLSVQIKKGWKGWGIRNMEKLSLRKASTLIGVSQVIVDDYKKNFPFYGKSHVLYNYVREDFLSAFTAELYNGGPLRLVAVGNLRQPKNYFYLIEAFKKLGDKDVHLDIYGDGPLHTELQDKITASGVNITLKGGTENTFEALKGHHVFVMVSSFEGFGIAVAEAMAAGMPLILSDIGVFREITDSNAFFIDISSVDSFTALIDRIVSLELHLNSLIEANRLIAKKRYSKAVYIKLLLKIYGDILNGQTDTIKTSPVF